MAFSSENNQDVINTLLNINHQSSKSYIRCSQYHSTSPTIRTQPFYLTDLSNSTKNKAYILFIPWDTDYRSWFQYRSRFFVPVPFLSTVPGYGSTVLGYGSWVKFLSIVPQFLGTVLVAICTKLTYRIPSPRHNKNTIHHNLQYGTNIPTIVGYTSSKLAIPGDNNNDYFLCLK